MDMDMDTIDMDMDMDIGCIDSEFRMSQSQLLQVHRSINQQGHLKPSPGENSANSPSQQHTISMGSTSPQGMPIPARRQGGGVQENQHWIPGLLTTGNNFGGGGGGMGGWSHGINYGLDTAMDSFNDISFNDGTELDPMEGELSKLSMAVDGNDDEIFKVERNDILGPTLAELNAPDADTLLDGLNFDDLYWPADAQLPPIEATPSPQTPAGALDPDGDLVPFHVVQSSSFPLSNIGVGGHKLILHQPSNSSANSVPATHIKIEPNLHQSNEITFAVSPSSSNQQQPQQPSSSGGLRELLLRRELQNSLDSPEGSSPLGQSLPRSSLSPTSNSFTQRLSTSAPTSQGNNAWETWQQRREAVWSRRDPRPHLLSTGSLAEAGSTSSLSADVLSPGREFSLSMDEGFDSDELSDRDSSDEESEVSDTESNAGSASGAARRERFFWQYNVQAKGPKGQRLVLAPTQEDPHVLHKPTDPVFSPLCHIQGIKHSGKARKGDGNDLTPNPRKLWVIGKELDRLNKVIAEMTPVADLPNAVKSRSRKEKNKLASRACRLKKKAQHEANKLKLYGLEQEHKRLMSAIEQSKQLVFAKMDGSSNDPEPVSVKVERLSKYGTKHKIGGHTTEFVNRVLEKVKSGVADGGINEL